jgi:uncharacterized protein (DUF934 family)
MPRLLRLAGHGLLEDDSTIYVDLETPGGTNGGATEAPRVLPWKRWQDEAEAAGAIGVWVDGDQEPAPLVPALHRIPLLAIRFGAMNDGRGLSLAVLLRKRHGYRGELRAVGATHEDLVHYYRRCGFDGVLFAEGRDLETALAGANVLSDFYQGSVVEPAPAFRRVARGAAKAVC